MTSGHSSTGSFGRPRSAHRGPVTLLTASEAPEQSQASVVAGLLKKK
ncbi:MULTISPECIES: hypothetical protein [unclassified Streptomyces]